jgi:uncharacterized membrane protein YdjX (TVP38/TMEM64 family)
VRSSPKVLFGLLLVGGLVLFVVSGGGRLFTEEGGLRSLVASFGETPAAIVYVTAFTVLGGLIVPGLVFSVAAPLVFPPWIAFGLSMLGGFGSCVVGFAAARYFARDWAQAHLPARLRNLDERLDRGGLGTTIAIRLGLYIIPPTHWAFGVSRIGWWSYLLGSTIGIVPWTLGATFGTTALVSWLGDQPVWVWIVLLSVVPLGMWWRNRSLRDEASAPGDA